MPDPRANRVAVRSGDLGISILARRDVAVMPALVASLASFALAAGEAARPDGSSPHSGLLAVLAVGFGAACAVWTLYMGPARRGAGESDRPPAGLFSFLLGFAILLGALIVAAVLERGLATVAFDGVVLMAPFVGLAFPRRWSRISIATLLLAGVAVHIARPEASGLEVASVLALIGAGWVVGLIARLGHANASRRALRLSRSDVLTRCLNRRGFLEEAEHRLQQGARAGEPVALIILDLDDFKSINDGQGHAEGDGLLTWVGAVIPPALPDEAVFGRLGGDEFAVLLPNADAEAAPRIAAALHRAVVERISASFGVATNASGAVDVDELLRTADLALYEAKSDADRAVRVRVAGDRPRPADEPDVARPFVPYARLRTVTRPLDAATPTTFNGTWIFAGYATIAISGAVFVLCTMLWGGDSFYEELIRYGGVPWIAANLGLGWAYRRRVHDVVSPLAVPIYGSSILVGIGVGTAALSTGSGIASPIIAGLFLKVFFDASTFRRRHGLQMTAIIVFCWIVVIVLGPGDALWAVPFQTVLILGAVALGSIARRAYEAATNAQLALARTDALTGLLNRAGFRERVERALRLGEAGDGLAVIAFDLDGFKQVNDTVGHLAGDRLLKDVADVTAATIPGAVAVARYGGDEFMAALTVSDRPRLDAVVEELDARLASVTQASVGSALFGPDGVTLDALLEVADHRAYAIKEQRHAEGPVAGRD